MHWKRSLPLIVFCLSGTPVLARTYHVDPVKGEMGAEGSTRAPLRSLAKLIGKLQPGDTVYLAAGTYAEQITLTESGTREKPIVIRNREGQKPVVESSFEKATFDNYTWRLNGACYVIIEGLTFRNCSPALLFTNGASDNTVRDNEFLDCPPVGRGGYERAIHGYGPTNCDRNLVVGNTFKRAYEVRGGTGPEGLDVKGGNTHWTIRGNRFSGYMYGLQLALGGPGYHLIEQNEFLDCHEGVHIKTTDNTIRGNHIHDLRRRGWMGIACGVFLRSCPRTVVENNRIERPKGLGIRVCGSDQVIRNNLITEADVGIWLCNNSWGWAKNSNWIVHNTVQATLGVWVSRGEALIYNNIFVGDKRSKMAVFAAGLGTNPMEALRPQWYGVYRGRDDAEARFIAGHNMVHGIAAPPSRCPAVDPKKVYFRALSSLCADPLFVDPQNGNYRLRKNSPALGAGRRLPNCSHDFQGRPRNVEAPDLGAFESSTQGGPSLAAGPPTENAMTQDTNTEADGLPRSTWDRSLSQMPCAVHGCFAASDGKRVYVIGGTSPAGHTDQIQIYHIADDRWEDPVALPWRGRLMVGGLTSHGLVVVFRGSYCVYRPSAGRVDGPFGLKRLSKYRSVGKAVVLGDRLVVVGGIWEDCRTSDRVVELNATDGSERALASMAMGRAHPEAVTYGQSVYVFGGRIGNYQSENLSQSVTDTIERYDSTADSWRLLDVRLPLPRMVATAVRIGKYALLFDGQPRNDALQMSSVWVFDLEKEEFVPNSWISPYAAWSGGVALAGGKVYLAGGNQLVYHKTPPGAFAMIHTIVNRFISFEPPLPPRPDPSPSVPSRIY